MEEARLKQHYHPAVSFIWAISDDAEKPSTKLVKHAFQRLPEDGQGGSRVHRIPLCANQTIIRIRHWTRPFGNHSCLACADRLRLHRYRLEWEAKAEEREAIRLGAATRQYVDDDDDDDDEDDLTVDWVDDGDDFSMEPDASDDDEDVDLEPEVEDEDEDDCWDEDDEDDE
jgi:hypothetical protein